MARKKIDRTKAIEALRAVFAKVDSGELGFFIQVVRETRVNTYVRLFVVENNRPRPITADVVSATGCPSKANAIVLGDYGTDRFLGLMYYRIGFTLYSDSSTALNWAHRYYRSVL